MSDLLRLTDEQIAPLRPFFLKSRGKPRMDDRRVLSRIVFWLDTPSASRHWFASLG